MDKVQRSRRETITKAGSTVFIAVAIAAVIIAFSAVCIKFLLAKKGYNDRVIAAKSKARDDIQTNLTNLNNLVSQLPALDSSPTTSSKVLLHALPPSYDYAALAASMEQLAQRTGVEFSGGIGSDVSDGAASEAPTSTPIEIPLNLTVSGSYDNVVNYIKTLEASIRPIHIDSVAFSGTNNKLTVAVTAKTYYQPARSLDVTRSPIQ